MRTIPAAENRGDEVTLCMFLSDPAVSSSIFVGRKGENLIRDDPDKSELSTLQYFQIEYFSISHLQFIFSSIYDQRCDLLIHEHQNCEENGRDDGSKRQPCFEVVRDGVDEPPTAFLRRLKFLRNVKFGCVDVVFDVKDDVNDHYNQDRNDDSKVSDCRSNLGEEKRERKGNYVRHVQNGADERNIAGHKKKANW